MHIDRFIGFWGTVGPTFRPTTMVGGECALMRPEHLARDHGVLIVIGAWTRNRLSV